jgi:hypothetical protein
MLALFYLEDKERRISNGLSVRMIIPSCEEGGGYLKETLVAS